MGYLGSKAQAGVFQRIISQMPPHSVYCEPFFGSGQIFFRKRPAVHNVIIDADAGLIAENDARIRAVAAAHVICGDAISELPRIDWPQDAVIYCDPPYLLSTRTSRHRYKHEMTDDDHAALLEVLRQISVRKKCCILLSGYPSKLYSKKLWDWRCISYRTRTRGRTLIECLWCNQTPPVELHDWSYFGENFRQRLSIKRFAARFLNRLDAMPPLKRNFVLSLLQQRQPVR